MKHLFKVAGLFTLAFFAPPSAANAYPASVQGLQESQPAAPLVKAGYYGEGYGEGYWRPRRRYYDYSSHYHYEPHYHYDTHYHYENRYYYGGGDGYYGHGRYWSHYRWGSYHRFCCPDGSPGWGD